MKNILLLGLSFFLAFSAIGQKQGHKIVIDFPEMADTTMLLAYHYGKKQYISDTLKFDGKGKAVIEGKEDLPHGVYLAVFPKLNSRYFEFLVKDQFFTVKVPNEQALNSPEFTNSKDNTIFYVDMKKMAQIRAQSQTIEAEINNSSDEVKKAALKDDLQKINDDFIAYREELMAANPDIFYTDLLGIMREVKIPEAPLNAEGKPDTQYQLQYYRAHYWDYVDFSEEGIIRTPMFEAKFNDFFDKYTYKMQDSIIVSCDIVLEKARANKVVMQYALSTLYNKYVNSKVMGDDAVYVHLIKNYYEKGDAWWADEKQIEKMTERRIALEPLLIGQISPDITLRDTTTRQAVRLHDLPSEYTIVYIWDPECGHCKKATPKLSTFYKKHLEERMVMVYAVTTSNIQELDKWKDFIKEYNLNWINVGDLYHKSNLRDVYDVSATPQVFILDKDKKIIAKRIGVEQIEGFFHQMLKNKGDERYKNFVLDETLGQPQEEHDEHDGGDHEGHNH